LKIVFTCFTRLLFLPPSFLWPPQEQLQAVQALLFAARAMTKAAAPASLTRAPYKMSYLLILDGCSAST
jgi:hypothetical protein